MPGARPTGDVEPVARALRERQLAQADPAVEPASYLGAITHASYAGEGKSDVEFGVQTTGGRRHLVMIENKIDATKQPDQAERYYSRGRFRVDRDEWDSFTVCLLAPRSYVSPAEDAEFDSVILYEDVVEHLETLPHDSTQFFQDVFGPVERKSVTTDASDTVNAVAEHFLERADTDDLFRVVSGQKRLSFASAHPHHPDAIRYDIYIATTGDEGRTNVRLQIVDPEDFTDADREALKSIARRHTDALPDYEWNFDRKENLAVSKVWHRDVLQGDQYDTYTEAIADELLTLVNTMHPDFVDAETD